MINVEKLPTDPQTVAEMVALLAKGEVYDEITDRIGKLEKKYRRLGAVIRLSFDLPTMTWGAYVAVWVDDGRYGSVRYANHYGGVAAASALTSIEKAFTNEFWVKAPMEKPCPRCGGLGTECYVDSEDNDYHLRACIDCPTGIAKKASMDAELDAVKARIAAEDEVRKKT